MCNRFPRKCDVQTSYKPSNYVLGLIFVVNIKFLRATYHTIVPSTEELYCLVGEAFRIISQSENSKQLHVTNVKRGKTRAKRRCWFWSYF